MEGRMAVGPQGYYIPWAPFKALFESLLLGALQQKVVIYFLLGGYRRGVCEVLGVEAEWMGLLYMPLRLNL